MSAIDARSPGSPSTPRAGPRMANLLQPSPGKAGPSSLARTAPSTPSKVAHHSNAFGSTGLAHSNSVKRLLGWPDQDGLTNIGTWKLPAGVDVRIAYWEVSVEKDDGAGNIGSNDRQRSFDIVTTHLKTMQHAEACLLACAERERPGHGETRVNDPKGKGRALDPVPDGDFAKSFLASRLLFATTAERSLIRRAKKRRAADTVDQKTTSLWLFKVIFNDSSGSVGDTSHFSAGKAVLELVNSQLAQEMTADEHAHAETFSRSRSAFTLESAFLMVDLASPSGILDISDIGSRPSVSRAFRNSLSSAFVAWILGRQSITEHSGGGVSIVPWRQGILLLPAVKEEPPTALAVDLKADLTCKILQVQFLQSPHKRDRQLSPWHFSPREGRQCPQLSRLRSPGGPLQIVLAPYGRSAIFHSIWKPKDRAEVSSSISELRSRLCDVMKASGCWTDKRVRADFEHHRFLVCQVENVSSAGNSHVLWPWALCFVANDDDDDGQVRSHSGLFPPQAYKGIKQTFSAPKYTLAILRGAFREASSELQLRALQADEEARAQAEARATDRIQQMDAHAQGPLETPGQVASGVPTETSPKAPGSPGRQVVSDKASPSPAREDVSSEGDADLWGEEEMGEASAALAHEDAASAPPQVTASLGALPCPLGTEDEFAGPTMSGVNTEHRNNPRAFEGMDFVTDDDFDFFGTGLDIPDIMMDAALEAANESSDQSQHLNFEIQMGEEERGKDTLPLSGPVNQSEVKSTTDANSLGSGVSSHIEEPSLSGLTPGSRADSSPAFGGTNFCKAPLTPADPPSLPAAPFADYDLMSETRPEFGILEETKAEDISFSLLSHVPEQDPPARQYTDIVSKYDGGKFTVPPEQKSSVSGSSVQPEPADAAKRERSALPLKNSFVSKLELRRLLDDDHSEVGTAEASESEQSMSEESDAGSGDDESGRKDEADDSASEATYLTEALQLGTNCKSPQSICEKSLPVSSHLDSADTAQVLSALVLDSSFRCGALCAPDKVHLLEQPQVLVSSLGAVVKLGGSALDFWRKMNLQPVFGPKDVQAYLLTEGEDAEARSEAFASLGEWRDRYQSLGLGNFAIQPDELVMEAEVDDWSESILAQLQSDEERWQDTLHSIRDRITATLKARCHAVVFVQPKRASHPDPQIYEALQSSLQLICLGTRMIHPLVNVQQLTGFKVGEFEAFTLFDSLELKAPSELSRELHRQPPSPVSSVRYPAWKLSPLPVESSRRFRLEWPQIPDHAHASPNLIHAAVHVTAERVHIACIDDQAEMWHHDSHPCGEDPLVERSYTWETILAFASRGSRRSTLVIALLSSPDSDTIGWWQAKLSSDKIPAWIEQIVFASISSDLGFCLPFGKHLPTLGETQLTTIDRHSVVQRGGDVAFAVVFGCDSLMRPFAQGKSFGSGLLVTARTPEDASPRQLGFTCLGASQPDLLGDGEVLVHQILVSYYELALVSRHRLNSQTSLPWHFVACLATDSLL